MRLVRTAVVVALAGGLVAGAVAGTSAQATEAAPGAAGVGDRLFPGLGNGGYDAAAYDVAFDYRPESTRMAASVTMRAVATQALSRFNLDSVGQTIAAVTVDGRPARFSTGGEELVITPARPLRKGRTFVTTVRYTADRAQEPPSAAFPDLGDPELKIHNWVRTPDGFALFGQPDRAHLFFPCNDHPSDKARFSFRVTVPRGLTAVANGRLAGRTETGGRTTFAYRTAHPMATHVAQVAVGRYSVVAHGRAGGVPLRSVVPTAQVEAATPFVRRTAQQLVQVARTLGRPFPFETYGVLGLTGDYNGLALESQTLSTFSDRALTAPEKDVASTQVHELVHQYFGDAVSVGTWSDMWLSEGHASFYEGFDMGPDGVGPVVEFLRQSYTRDAGNRALFGPPARPKAARNVLLGTNEGGALTLYALRQKIGAQKFQQVERAFLERFQHRSATTQDYVDTVNRVTGRDLTGFLRAWLYGPTTPPMPGHPDWTPGTVPATGAAAG